MFYKTGSINFTWASDNIFHSHNITTQLNLYLAGYKLEQAGLTAAVVLRVYRHHEIQDYAPMLAHIWEDTYAMCAEMRSHCTLRHCLIDKFLAKAHVTQDMTREDFRNSEIYPEKFRTEFFRQLALLEVGRYKLSDTGAIYLKFDPPVWWKKKARKPWDPQEMHHRVL